MDGLSDKPEGDFGCLGVSDADVPFRFLRLQERAMQTSEHRLSAVQAPTFVLNGLFDSAIEGAVPCAKRLPWCSNSALLLPLRGRVSTGARARRRLSPSHGRTSLKVGCGQAPGGVRALQGAAQGESDGSVSA